MGVIWGWVLVGGLGECEMRVLFIGLDTSTRDGRGVRIPGGSLQWGRRARAVLPPLVLRDPGVSRFLGCILFFLSPVLSGLSHGLSLGWGSIVSGFRGLPEVLRIVWAWGVGSSSHVQRAICRGLSGDVMGLKGGYIRYGIE